MYFGGKGIFCFVVILFGGNECANWEIMMYCQFQFLNFEHCDILMEGLKALIWNASTLQFSELSLPSSFSNCLFFISLKLCKT